MDIAYFKEIISTYEYLILGLVWLVGIILIRFFTKGKGLIKNQGLNQGSFKMAIIGWGYAFFGSILTGTIGFFINQTPFDRYSLQPVGINSEVGLGWLMLAFISLVLIVPIGEELMFRGVIFGELKERVGPTISALITSLIFSLAHFDIYQSPNTFLLALTLCAVYHKAANITDVIIIHMVNNFFAILVTLNPFSYFMVLRGGVVAFIVGYFLLVKIIME